MNTVNINLTVAGAGNMDASLDFVTDQQLICNTYVWGLSMQEAGLTTETGKYTVEVSNGVDWKEYKDLSTNVAVINAVDDTHMAWLYFRVSYMANGETTGTLNPILTLKS